MSRSSIPKVRDDGNHSLSMLGSERYKNQLATTSNTELFSSHQKNRSMYRRPSEMGLSTTPMESTSEVKGNFQQKNIGRGHIVKPIPDHLETYHASVPEWEEEHQKDSEAQSVYKDLHAKRPVCHRIADTLKMEGDMVKESEVKSHFKDLHSKRPVCNKIADHDTQIRAQEPMQETSEYRSTINKFQTVVKGDRALPPWLGMEKVTPFGTDQNVTRQ